MGWDKFRPGRTLFLLRFVFVRRGRSFRQQSKGRFVRQPSLHDFPGGPKVGIEGPVEFHDPLLRIPGHPGGLILVHLPRLSDGPYRDRTDDALGQEPAVLTVAGGFHVRSPVEEHSQAMGMPEEPDPESLLLQDSQRWSRRLQVLEVMPRIGLGQAGMGDDSSLEVQEPRTIPEPRKALSIHLPDRVNDAGPNGVGFPSLVERSLAIVGDLLGVGIVIPEDAMSAQFPNQVDAGGGRSAVTDDVSPENDLLGAGFHHSLEDGLERRQVPMDVGKESYFGHVKKTVAAASRAVAFSPPLRPRTGKWTRLATVTHESLQGWVRS